LRLSRDYYRGGRGEGGGYGGGCDKKIFFILNEKTEKCDQFENERSLMSRKELNVENILYGDER